MAQKLKVVLTVISANLIALGNSAASAESGKTKVTDKPKAAVHASHAKAMQPGHTHSHKQDSTADHLVKKEPTATTTHGAQGKMVAEGRVHFAGVARNNRTGKYLVDPIGKVQLIQRNKPIGRSAGSGAEDRSESLASRPHVLKAHKVMRIGRKEWTSDINPGDEPSRVGREYKDSFRNTVIYDPR